MPGVNHNPKHPACSKSATQPRQTFAEILEHLWSIGWNGPVTMHCRKGIPTFVEFGRRQIKLGT